MRLIMIIMLKIFKRINSLVKILFYKIIYSKSLRIGINTILYPRVHIIIEKTGNVEIGKNCFFNCNCSINSIKKIKIGDDCIFGENVCLYDHDHEFKKSGLIRLQGYNSREIIIGKNCWIGSNVVILKGVKIGNNCVIGAGTIVNKDIPDNIIVYNKSELVMRVVKNER